MANISVLRSRMVDRQVAARGVKDMLVLNAMRIVPREAFVPDELAEFAYEDTPLPIADNQTISQPYIVGLMLAAAELTPGDKVLEVGAGSGYAAAVMSRIARMVFAIERHDGLTRAARERAAKLHYDNIVFQTGDGTTGWPEEAPFDAILVAAGGPSVPETLKAQLALGGRLVIPVGSAEREQRLLRITRLTQSTYQEDMLGAVTFVPLIGREGWPEDGSRAASNHKAAATRTLPQMISEMAQPLAPPDDPLFGAAFDRLAGNARVVLLGEASHGTAEFYQARAAITKRLIEHHGFTIVAVEADWPDAAAIDRYVRQRSGGPANYTAFERFPTWMWRNTDVAEFVEWMRAHNEMRPPEKRAGFYGLDIYNMHGSIAAVLAYLDKVDPHAARIARERYACLTPWQKDPAVYGRAVLSEAYRKCEEDVIAQCQDLLRRQLDYAQNDGVNFLDAAQNARLIAAAERYYRIMYYGGAESWNLRDTHMFETLVHVLDAGGPNAKAVVWAHNSHIGDARATEMGLARGEHNIGQLAREKFGEAAQLIGFGTDTGTVAAATDWDGDMQIKRVRPAHRDSFERHCHETGRSRFLLDFHKDSSMQALKARLEEPLLERFIGVIYRPETEMVSHYSQAAVSRQFDAYVWFDQTKAVTPLGPEYGKHGVPDTYPFGV